MSNLLQETADIRAVEAVRVADFSETAIERLRAKNQSQSSQAESQEQRIVRTPYEKLAFFAEAPGRDWIQGVQGTLGPEPPVTDQMREWGDRQGPLWWLSSSCMRLCELAAGIP